MADKVPHNHLSERQENICEYGGAFGVLLSLTCLIQHINVTRSHWLTYTMALFYLYAMMAFLVLGLKKTVAPLLIIISAVCSLVLQYIWMKQYAFSLVVLSLFFYHVVMIIALYVEQVPQKLKEKRIAEIKEEQEWMGKL